MDETDNNIEEAPKKKISELSYSECTTTKQKFAWILNYIFIDGMSGMALGLFATLIAGTIVWQIGHLINGQGSLNNVVGLFLESLGKIAQITMGAGIGIGICLKLKNNTPLVVAGAAAAAMIGSYAKVIIGAISGAMDSGTLSITLASAGDPMGAFVGGISGMALGKLVSGKTKVDILVTPLTTVVGGSIIGIAVGYPTSLVLTALGDFIAYMASLSLTSAALTGMVISAIMGIALTMPISSAAIGISVGLNGVAAGAAVVGCCCQMVGFAVMSFKENSWSGLFAQGLGTSMLQIPNVFKKPVLIVPPIISSMILGLISPLLPVGLSELGLFATKVGSGMGTAGLVGPIDMVFAMINNGANVLLTLLFTVLFCIVLPGTLTWTISKVFRKVGIIKDGDLTLIL